MDSKKKGIGRPRTIPPGAEVRSLRATDREWAAILALVKRMRKGSGKP
jgi:hypothetical protein